MDSKQFKARRLAFLFISFIIFTGCTEKQNTFQYDWQGHDGSDIIGSGFLAKNKQDWHVNDGRLETTFNAKERMRMVFLENRKIDEPFEPWSLSVEAGWQDTGNISHTDGNRIGLLIGIPDNMPNQESGFFFGVETSGKIIIKNLEKSKVQELTSLENTLPLPDSFLLTLTVKYENNNANMLFEVKSIDQHETYAQIVWESKAYKTQGNIALVADPNTPQTFRGCWFNNFSIVGNSIASKNIYTTS